MATAVNACGVIKNLFSAIIIYGPAFVFHFIFSLLMWRCVKDSL